MVSEIGVAAPGALDARFKAGGHLHAGGDGVDRAPDLLVDLHALLQRPVVAPGELGRIEEGRAGLPCAVAGADLDIGRRGIEQSRGATMETDIGEADLARRLSPAKRQARSRGRRQQEQRRAAVAEPERGKSLREIDIVAARVQVPASPESRLKGAGGGDANL